MFVYTACKEILADILHIVSQVLKGFQFEPFVCLDPLLVTEDIRCENWTKF